MTLSHEPDHPSPAQIAGVLLILGAMVVRVTSSFDPFPGWSGDPFRLPSPIVGVTPSISLALDLLTLFGAMMALCRGAARRSTWSLLALAGVGGLSIAWHSRPSMPDGLDHVLLGSAWLAALVGAIAVRHASASPLIRRICVGCVMGILPLLVFKALSQVYVDHPETVREYQRSKRDFLESQGWTVGSPMALAYERRLMQAEGSGWFGLANVYASLVAAGCVAFLGLAWAAWRSRERAAAAILGVCAVLAALGTTLAGSKGGYAAMGIGVVMLAVIPLARCFGSRERCVLGMLAGGVVAGSLAAVAIRGLIGERIGELSILFRWFYMQGAARIFAEHPALGVGPAGFKDAYMLLKNPLSPEDVASPHSILFDYAATLGIGGLCLALAWMVLVVCTGLGGAVAVAVARWPDKVSRGPEFVSIRGETRLVAIVAAVGIIVSAWLEQPISTVLSTLLRLMGIAACGVVGWAVVRVMRAESTRAVHAALSASALALAAHCQIEMTPITPGAALWAMLAIALASEMGKVQRWESPGRLSPASNVPLVAFAVLLLGAVPVWRWEAHLRGGYNIASPVAEIAQRAAAVFGGRPEGDSAPLIARELGAMLGTTVEPSASGIGLALNQLRLTVLPLATAELRDANKEQPGHFPTSRALARLCLISAEVAPDEARRRFLQDEAAAVSLDAARRWKGGSAAWAWLATTREAIANADPRRSDPRAVVEALEHAVDLAPHEPIYQVKLAITFDALAATDAAAAAERGRWAARALEADRTLRLDPLRRLSDSDRSKMEKFAGGG